MRGRSARLAIATLLAASLAPLGACQRSEAGLPITSRPDIAMTGRVTDAASVLTPEVEASLSDTLGRLERKTGHQLVIATTPSLHGQSIETYSLDLARNWRIGRKGYDDGVLILVAPAERKVRIEVGYGLEKTLSNPLCKDIIDRQMLPSFQKADYADGIARGTKALIAHLE